MHDESTLWHYLRKGKSDVDGWLQRIDAEIIGKLLCHQQRSSVIGGCFEIGVHHGKSFIPLCMSLGDGELAGAVDLFDQQERNLDLSGRGDRSRFESNLANHRISLKNLWIHQGSSADLSSPEIVRRVGRVRFFSIDGGHWQSIVLNDLELAEESLSDEGIIALDDYCRAEWPEVSTGYAIWQSKTTSDIVPFAAGSNKLYLCRKPLVATYRGALKSAPLSDFLRKTYSNEAGSIDIYRVEPVEQDEANFRRALRDTLMIFRPDLYRRLRRLGLFGR
jgi:hypothetical protein